MRRFIFITLLVGALFALWAVPAAADSGAGDASHGSDGVNVPAPVEAGIPEFFVPPPPFSEDIFPCSDCHEDMDVNPERRELEEFHEEIQIINHNEEERWCLDCHNPDNRDVLRLVNGKLISFEESYLLCGQCHGTIFRDWKAGVHGRRTGEWNGKKLYRLCVHCHNPHKPRFQPLAPKPPPIKPKDIR